MIKEVPVDWFTEEYGFFGEFYYNADNSFEGPFRNEVRNRSERTSKEIEIINSFLEIQEGDTVFDCPCGWGRHSLILGKQGIKITAIDLNRFFLNRFNESIKQVYSYNQENIKIVRSDMRNLPVEYNESFNFGINMFSSFGFFNDNENKWVAQSFYNLLKPGGKLLMHFDFNAERIIRRICNDYADKRTLYLNGGQIFLDVFKEYDDTDKRLYGHWKMLDINHNIVDQKKYSFRIYNNEEIIELLSEVGFSEIELYSTKKKELTLNDIETIIIAKK